MSAIRQNTERKAPKTAFKPGQSGNPSGRPKRTAEQKDALAMIRALAPEAAERLKAIITDDSVKADTQLKAIEIILERTYGKPVAYDAAGTNVTNELLMSLLELEKRAGA